MRVHRIGVFDDLGSSSMNYVFGGRHEPMRSDCSPFCSRSICAYGCSLRCYWPELPRYFEDIVDHPYARRDTFAISDLVIAPMSDRCEVRAVGAAAINGLPGFGVNPREISGRVRRCSDDSRLPSTSTSVPVIFGVRGCQ